MNYKARIPKNFLLFIILSLLFWLLITFSKEYKTEISFPINYINLPQNKLFQKPPPLFLKIGVKGTGFKVLSAKMSPKKINLDANYLSKKTLSKYYFLLERQQIAIQKQLNYGIEIDVFTRDSIFLNLDHLATKKVPIIPSLAIEYKAGYDLSKKIRVTPDSVSIFGPKATIDTIYKLTTEKLELFDVTENISKEVSIQLSKHTNLKINEEKVLLEGEVDRFTEGALEMSFLIENVPEGVTLNTFPKKVKIIFKVGLEDFQKINENSFKIVCDYRVSEKGNYSYLIPKIKKQSALIKNVRIVPNKIDFLIQK